jgi:hypothetical protein
MGLQLFANLEAALRVSFALRLWLLLVLIILSLFYCWIKKGVPESDRPPSRL